MSQQPKRGNRLSVTIAILAFSGLPPFALALPDLGAGDPNIVVWMDADSTHFTIFKYDSAKSISEMDLVSGACNPEELELIYPQHVGAIVEPRLLHCFPLGRGRCFVRQADASTGGHKNLVLLAEEEGTISATSVSDEEICRSLPIPSNCRLLGVLDNKLFYWDMSQPHQIKALALDTKVEYRWNEADVYNVLGVLQGNHSFLFVVSRARDRIGTLKYWSRDLTKIELRLSDAVVEPKR